MVANPKFNQEMTVDEFEEFLTLPENHDRHFELIDGIVVEKSMATEAHGVAAGNIHAPIWNYVKETKQGRVVFEVRSNTPGDRRNSRQPDISYFVDSNRPVTLRGATPQLPELAVEVKSPDDTYKEMREKAAYYLTRETQVVWLVFIEKRIVEVYTREEQQVLTMEDTLKGGTVLPGFTLKVADIFEGI